MERWFGLRVRSGHLPEMRATTSTMVTMTTSPALARF